MFCCCDPSVMSHYCSLIRCSCWPSLTLTRLVSSFFTFSLKWWIQMFLLVWLSADIPHSDSCKSLWQRSPCRAGVRPHWGKALPLNETKSLFCSHIGAKACVVPPLHSNACDQNVQECLIWLKPVLKGRVGRERGERRLACHCIIPAAINSLCPEPECTHHSKRPLAEWHQQLSISPQLLLATPVDLNRRKKTLVFSGKGFQLCFISKQMRPADYIWPYTGPVVV